MKICAMSDLHGQLPAHLPRADVYVIAGDICPNGNPISQAHWLRAKFGPWCSSLDAPVIATAGNHDAIFEKPHLVPEGPYHLLLDKLVTVQGLRFFGSPWTKTFFDWSFMKDEPELERHFALIPPADVYLMHSPPYGMGDFSPYNHDHTGSPELLARIREYKPKLVVWGHIHSGRGEWRIGDTILANVSMVDEQYRPVHEPMMFELGI